MALSDSELIQMAREARKHAYVPYSGFAVGAVAEDEQGRLTTGCNIENASYGATICAERVAIQTAVGQGVRKIRRIAVVCNESKPCMPCGICRQVMSEFATDDFILLCAGGQPDPDGPDEDNLIRLTLDEVLPHRFQF